MGVFVFFFGGVVVVIFGGSVVKFIIFGVIFLINVFSFDEVDFIK